uniref:T-cell receptor alpha chain constant domain-containing protein n=1 Tax=Anas zonorhyncha TaxID=75864 RepID=A0A8B9UH08_9AVES
MAALCALCQDFPWVVESCRVPGCLITVGDHLQRSALLDGNVSGWSNMTPTAVPLSVLEHVAPHQLPDFAVTLWKSSLGFLKWEEMLCDFGSGNKLTFGSGTRLSVLPKVVPSPSVYRLTTKDDENLEMCLITDYAPKNLNVKSDSADSKTEAVVEVETSENKQEASYLTTYWANKNEMECGAEDKKAGKLEGKDPKSGASTVCVTGMSPHFKTDENLNMLSFTQLGLKIILMKAVIFNVVMTILMWKKKE